MRLAKERPGAKIDLLAALSFACLTAVRDGTRGEPGIIGFYRERYGPGAAAQPDQPISDDDRDDLTAYCEERRRYYESLNPETSNCHYCGKKIKGITTNGTDGRPYHPACWPEKLKGPRAR